MTTRVRSATEKPWDAWPFVFGGVSLVLVVHAIIGFIATYSATPYLSYGIVSTGLLINLAVSVFAVFYAWSAISFAMKWGVYLNISNMHRVLRWVAHGLGFGLLAVVFLMYQYTTASSTERDGVLIGVGALVIGLSALQSTYEASRPDALTKRKGFYWWKIDTWFLALLVFTGIVFVIVLAHVQNAIGANAWRHLTPLIAGIAYALYHFVKLVLEAFIDTDMPNFTELAGVVLDVAIVVWVWYTSFFFLRA